MKKAFKYFLWLIIFVTFVAASAAGGLIYWAYTGPRDLSQYMPDIESSINESLKNNRVKIGSAKLAYGGFEQPIYIDATKVVIYNNKKAEVVSLDEMQLSYNLFKIMRGNIFPSKIKLVGVTVDTADFFEESNQESFNLKDFDLSRVRRIEIQKGRLKIGRINEIWNVDSLKLKFRGSKMSLAGTLYPSKTEKITLAGKGYYNRGDFTLIAKAENIITKRFAAFAPEMEGADFLFSGIVETSLKNEKLEAVKLNVNSLKGHLVNPKIRAPLAIVSAAGEGSYNFRTKNATLHKSVIAFADGLKMDINGSYTNSGDIKATGKLDHMRIENLHKYWPINVGNNALDWINLHLSKGIISNANAKIDIKGSDYEAGTIPESAVNLTYDISGMDVDYVDGLLPVINASGKAHMDAGNLYINITNGKLGASIISNTKVHISEIGGVQEHLLVDGNLQGDAKDIADFYIKVNKRRGKELLLASTEDLSGSASSKLVLKLPLKAGLKFEQVSINLNSQLTNISAKSDKISAKNANVNLIVNDAGYAIKGTVVGGFKSAKYSFDNMPMKIDYSKNSGLIKTIIDADITNAAINIAQLGAAKPKGEKGRAEVILNGVTLSKFVIESAPLKIVANGTLNSAQDDILNMEITNFESAKTKFSAKIQNNDGYNITMDAKTFNAVPIMENMGKKGGEAKDPTKIKIKAKIEKLLFYKDQQLANVTLDATCATECSHVELNSKDLKISQTPSKLKITSDNAGKVLKMLDAYDNMGGGKMVVDAKGNSKGEYSGTAVIEEFTMQKAKVLAKILTIGSLTGIADLLQGNGISFKKLKTNFTRNDNELIISDFRMFGSSIGITTEGKLNRKTDAVEFQGKIIPSYTANTLLGKIPVLGNIIIGDEGVFAFAYTVKGKVDDPDVFVNPLSVLAPGFLQEIFQ